MRRMARKGTGPFEREKGSHAWILVKMNSVTWPINPGFFHDVLMGLRYQDIIVSDDRSVRAAKPNYAFTSHVPGLFLQFDSNRVGALIDAQREFFAALVRDYKMRMEDHVAYYQMGYTCEYILDKPVDTTYAKALDDSDIKSIFESVTGRNLVLNKIEMSSGGRIDATDWYSIEVSTRVESSGNTLFCKMMRVSVDLREIHKAVRSASETISKIVDGLTATH